MAKRRNIRTAKPTLKQKIKTKAAEQATPSPAQPVARLKRIGRLR